MFHTRITKTASGATAVQVVRYKNRKKIIVVHIGSAHSKAEILSLKQTATHWIEHASRQPSLLPVQDKKSSALLPLDKCQYLGIRYTFIYEILSQLFILFKFHLFHNPLLTDLILMRIVEPVSKLRSLELLEQYFGIKHSPNNFYKQLKGLTGLKDQAEDKILMVAKKHFNFDFSLVFYDVTTLYFESFKPDDLRKCGFSKDNKANQPQIVIGLMVNNLGFPVAHEIFAGNKFEGHTFIPVITAFQHKHQIKQFTVVADAAMLSMENIETLKAARLNYIVGAKLSNLSETLHQKISQRLSKTDGATIRITTNCGDLICGFSQERFRKDKHEMDKQINRANTTLKEPSKLKRIKFVKNITSNRYELNIGLIEKQKAFLGVKGYYTNLSEKVDNQTIIRHYHNLWHVEQAFRIAKGDLQMRPIYHFKEQTIKAHVLICFMALAVSKYMEIKTSRSLKCIVQSLKGVTDARILNTLTQKEIILRSEITDEATHLLKQLGVWY